MKKLTLLASLVVIGLSGCGPKEEATTEGTTGSTGSSAATTGSSKPLVVFAQANSQDPWRQVFDRDTKAAADKLSGEMAFEMQEAKDDSATQISQIETLLVKKPAVLLVSPVTESVQAATDKAFDAGVPVILLDRSVPGDKYTAYIGGDNVEIGKAAGEYMGELLKGKGTVLMIQGTAGAIPTRDRANGFLEAVKKFPGIKVIQGDDCGYQRERGRKFMETYLAGGKAFDAVYAHNDEMAIGAMLAMEAAGTPLKPIIGIDACQKEVVQYIQEGKISATFSYPQPGPRGVELAAEIIKGTKPAEKKILLPTEKVTKENAADYLAKYPNLVD
ncbi:MAG: Ribose import binding protein RbsB [Fimbriimonadaceae bacterium]|nr:Ribose import binding protein RbsB [Fimbriimonadaceae bacterium]